MAHGLQEAPAPSRTRFPGLQPGACARDSKQGTQATGVCFAKQMALPGRGDARACGNPSGLDLALTTPLLQLRTLLQLPGFATLSPQWRDQTLRTEFLTLLSPPLSISDC